MIKQFHEAQIIIAGVVLVVAMFTYVLGPEDRIQLPHDIALVCLAFLFGKFTNGFSRAKPTRWDDAPEAKINGPTDTSSAVVRDTQSEQDADTGARTWPHT